VRLGFISVTEIKYVNGSVVYDLISCHNECICMKCNICVVMVVGEYGVLKPKMLRS
jgi:hypothetical protein